MEIVWSSFATEGLFSILEYVETDFGSRVSQRVYTDIMGYIETLTKFPNQGIHDDIFSTETLEVRYLICKQNIIYYLIYNETERKYNITPWEDETYTFLVFGFDAQSGIICVFEEESTWGR